MINPDIITRDDSRGVTYFIGELQEGKTYAIFSLYDMDALENNAARLEYIGGSVEEALEAIKIALRPEKIKKKAAAASDTDEAVAPSAPVKRKRTAAVS